MLENPSSWNDTIHTNIHENYVRLHFSFHFINNRIEWIRSCYVYSFWPIYDDYEDELQLEYFLLFFFQDQWSGQHHGTGLQQDQKPRYLLPSSRHLSITFYWQDACNTPKDSQHKFLISTGEPSNCCPTLYNCDAVRNRFMPVGDGRNNYWCHGGLNFFAVPRNFTY